MGNAPELRGVFFNYCMGSRNIPLPLLGFEVLIYGFVLKRFKPKHAGNILMANHLTVGY